MQRRDTAVAVFRKILQQKITPERISEPELCYLFKEGNIMNFNEAVEKIMAMIESDRFGNQLAIECIRRSPGDGTPPCWSYSLLNRLIVAFSGSQDVRGMKTWNKLGAKIKAGSHAVKILAPLVKIRTVTDPDTGEEEKRKIIYGFRWVNTYKYEDLETPPDLEMHDYTPKEIVPFEDVCREMGLDVRYRPLTGCYGYYSPGKHEIVLGVNEGVGAVITITHELSHHAQQLLHMEGSRSNDVLEASAELAAQVLCQIYGFTGTEKQSADYVKAFLHVRNGEAKEVLKKIGEILADTEAIVNKIISVKEMIQPVPEYQEQA
jgi:hypothetical protein